MCSGLCIHHYNCHKTIEISHRVPQILVDIIRLWLCTYTLDPIHCTWFSYSWSLESHTDGDFSELHKSIKQILATSPDGKILLRWMTFSVLTVTVEVVEAFYSIHKWVLLHVVVTVVIYSHVLRQTGWLLMEAIPCSCLLNAHFWRLVGLCGMFIINFVMETEHVQLSSAEVATS